METDFTEIDEGANYIGYSDALGLVYSSVRPVGVEKIPVNLCVGRVVAEDVVALVSNPSSDVSLKDGFAVKSENVTHASRHHPVRLRIKDSVFAGSEFAGEVMFGSAVKVCSGAQIPQGADAVVSGEFCKEISPGEIDIRATAEHGRNILRAGGEVKAGTTIVEKKQVLLPGLLGLLAAAGIHRVKVYRQPSVAVIAVGDEVVAPGGYLRPGQLYASNLVTMGAWLSSFNVTYDSAVIKDNADAIKQELLKQLPGVDAIITSGGAWGSERDLVVGLLGELGWEQVFHHVRMGPGKGIAFGLLRNKPVFCLPGGPASNEMAFLQFALPGILHMGGQSRHPLWTVWARLTRGLESRHRAWTEFREATLSRDADGSYIVTPYHHSSRLLSIAHTTSLVCIAEGVASLDAGDVVTVQVLAPHWADILPLA